MIASRRRRLLTVILGGVLLVGGISVSVIAIRDSQGACEVSVDGFPVNIIGTLGTVEAVVVVDAAEPLGTMKGSRNWTPVPAWLLNVADTLYVAAESREATDEDWGDLQLSAVPTPEGVIESLGACDVDLAAALDEAGELIVFLSAPDPVIFTDLEVPWKVITAAWDTPEGLVFVDSDGADLTDNWHQYMERLGDSAAVSAAENRVAATGELEYRIPEVGVSLGADPTLTQLELELAVSIVDSASRKPRDSDVYRVLLSHP